MRTHLTAGQMRVLKNLIEGRPPKLGSPLKDEKFKLVMDGLLESHFTEYIEGWPDITPLGRRIYEASLSKRPTDKQYLILYNLANGHHYTEGFPSYTITGGVPRRIVHTLYNKGLVKMAIVGVDLTEEGRKVYSAERALRMYLESEQTKGTSNERWAET